MELTRDIVEEAISNQLTPGEVTVLRLLTNLEIAEAAEAIGVSRQYMYQTRNTALAKLKTQGVIMEVDDDEED